MADRVMEKKMVPFSYDNDTGLGINNEGKLVFGYSLLDTDKVNGENVYTGQDSVFWRLVSQAYSEEIKTLYQTLRQDERFSYDYIEQMFEEHQGKWPIALRNEDSWFCYIIPFLESGENYLEMCLGSKSAQRKWWLYHRFKYLDSMYRAGDARTNYISLRGYAKSDFHITPYADIFIDVRFGSRDVQVRANRNVEYTIECPLDTVSDTETYIYSSDMLSSIGDMSGYQADTVNTSMAPKLLDVKFGKKSTDYINQNLKTINLGRNKMLELVELSRCVNLTGTQDFSGCTGLKTVHLWDTRVTGVTLSTGGVLEELDLPGTITNLTIRNQPNLRTFAMGNVIDTEPGENGVIIAKVVNGQPVYTSAAKYSGITTLRLENIPDNVIPLNEILAAMPNNARVRLAGFHWEMDDTDEIDAFYDVLDKFRGLDESGGNTDTAQVIGTIHIPSAKGSVLAELQARYPYVTINADSSEAYVYYHRWDGTNISSEKVLNGGNAVNAPTIPARAADAQYTYTALGWATSQDSSVADAVLTNVVADRHVYAAYTKTLQSYPINWSVNGTTTTETYNYGDMPTWKGATPTSSTGTFKGWSPAVTTVTGSATYTAMFSESGVWVTPNFDVSGAYAVQYSYGDSNKSVLVRGGAAESFADPVPATSKTGSGSSPFDNIAPWKDMKAYNVTNGAIGPMEGTTGFSYSEDTVIKIPEFYYHTWKDESNGRHYWAISPTAKSGYTKHPGSGKYIGKYHANGTTSAITSKTGLNPLANVSLTNFRTAGNAKGDNWRIIDLAAWSALQMLYLVEFANFDSQAMLGTGADTGSVIAEGTLDGATYHTVKASKAENMYRGVVNPFSNVFTWTDGFIANGTEPYISTDPSVYKSSTDGLTKLGFNMPASNWISEFGYDANAEWAFIPSASSSTEAYIKDKVYTSSGLRGLCVGGSCSSSSSYGLFCFDAYGAPSSASAGIGSRLLFEAA